MAIPALLIYFLWSRRRTTKIPHSWIVWMFAAFIMGCGLTHLMGIVVFYEPLYYLDGVVKILTGLISIATVVGLAWLVPKLLDKEAATLGLIMAETKKHIKLYFVMVFAVMLQISLKIYALINNTPMVSLVGTLVSIVILTTVFIAFVRINANLETANISLSEFQTMFDLAHDMVCIASGEKFLRVNDAFLHTLGYSREELLTKSFLEFIHPEDLDRTKSARVTAATEGVVGFENRYRTKSGEWRWLSWTASPSGKGDIVYGVARDITETKMIQAQLLRSNKELEQFAYVASHDLKAPLRAVNNLVQWIEEDLEGKELSDESKKHMRLIHERIARMNSLIEGILQYSRVGRVYIEEEELDLSELVNIVLATLDTKKFAINVEALPTVRGNRTTVLQLFTNLISNSIKHHSREDGHIWIAVKDLDETYEFSVRDDGPGIDPVYRHKLFGLFQTFKTTTPDSTGVGLALCKKIVEGKGGKIWEEGEYGKGANFKFTWPK